MTWKKKENSVLKKKNFERDFFGVQGVKWVDLKTCQIEGSEFYWLSKGILEAKEKV